MVRYEMQMATKIQQAYRRFMRQQQWRLNVEAAIQIQTESAAVQTIQVAAT